MKSLLQRASLPSLICLGAAVAGAMCLLVGFRLQWFPLPWPAQNLAEHKAVLHGVDAPCVLAWKCALALGLAATGVYAWRRPAQWRSIGCVALGVITAVLLFFPASLLYFAPVQVSRANWIELQHRNITSLGGDISASSEIQNRDWRMEVTVIDLPRQVGAVQIPKSIPNVLELGRMTDAAEWLGYSDAFCAFAGKGWMFALAGSALLLAAAARGCAGVDCGRAKLALTVLGGSTFALFLAASAPVLVTGFFVGRAHAAIQEGDYAASRHWLDTAGAVMPVIRENSFFMIQEGVIDDKLNRDTLEAAHYHAMCLENGQFYTQAETAYRDLLDRTPANSAIQRETLRDLLRLAVRDLKSDEMQRSIPLLELVLHYDPVNLKANRCLQAVYLRVSRYDDLADMISSMRQIYAYMGTVTKMPALEACQENEALLRFRKGDLEGALADRRTLP